MKPRPHVSKKVIISIILSILVVVCLLFGMYVAFSGINPSTQNNQSEVKSSQTSGVFNELNESTDKKTLDEEKEDNLDVEESKGKDQQEEILRDEEMNENKENKPLEESTKTTMSAQKIWDYLRGAMGESLIANLSLSPENMQSLYGIDPAICEEIVFQKAGTVVTPEEYLIVKASPANLSIIEQACHQRQVVLLEQWARNEKDMVEMINNYQIVRSGSFIFFGISPQVSQLAGIFQGLMMSGQ